WRLGEHRGGPGLEELARVPRADGTGPAIRRRVPAGRADADRVGRGRRWQPRGENRMTAPTAFDDDWYATPEPIVTIDGPSAERARDKGALARCLGTSRR